MPFIRSSQLLYSTRKYKGHIYTIFYFLPLVVYFVLLVFLCVHFLCDRRLLRLFFTLFIMAGKDGSVVIIGWIDGNVSEDISLLFSSFSSSSHLIGSLLDGGTTPHLRQLKTVHPLLLQYSWSMKLISTWLISEDLSRSLGRSVKHHPSSSVNSIYYFPSEVVVLLPDCLVMNV